MPHALTIAVCSIVHAAIAADPCIVIEGGAELVNTPANVARHVYESSTDARVFLERERVMVSAGQTLNAVTPGTRYRAYADFEDVVLETDTLARVYFVHLDSIGAEALNVEGSVTFPTPIVGIIGRSLTMEQTDGTLGAPETFYPTNRFNRELEFAGRGELDYFELSDDLTTVSFRMHVDNGIDQFRIIIEHPDCQACPAELSGDVPPDISVVDLLIYLDRWLASADDAEFDGTAGIGVPDLVAYVDAWFAPCPG